MAKNQEPKRKRGGGGRTTVLAALLAVVALVAIWLSDCIPGFGTGSSGDAEGEAEQVEKAEPAQPEPEKVAEPEPVPEPEPAANKTLMITIDVRGCSIDGAAPSDCASVCERAELFAGVDDAILQVEEASHGSVTAMVDCLKSKGIDKVAINRE
jgi:hypothetical protein